MIREAAEFAEKAHRGAVRKGSDIPYITHPLETAVITSMMSDDDEPVSYTHLDVYKRQVNSSANVNSITI